ncbi:hypothetical protein HED60_22375 [Planctomycetales bacterium ZRK34]|nr:hypothetical protein HED60_22375 [Planctomycetales bacterium ZRK34]
MLGLIFAVAGGTLGYRMTEPVYRAFGTIRVQPILPRVLYQQEQNSLLPMFDAYVGSQVAMIESSRVLNRAMKSNEWDALGRGRTPDDIQQFHDNLEVSHPRNSELIVVAFEDIDPEASRRAVKAVIDSYVEIFGDTDVQSVNYRLEQLQQRSSQLRSELASKDRMRQSIASEFGSNDLETIYQAKLTEVNGYDQQIKQLKVRIQLTKNMLNGKSGEVATDAGEKVVKPDEAVADEPESDDKSAEAVAPLTALTAVEIAQQDRQMLELMNQKEALEREMARLKLSLGENHRQVLQTRTLLESIEDSIVKRTAEFNQQLQQMGGAVGTGETLAQLEERLKALQQLYDTTKEETTELGKKNLRLQSLATEMETTKARLNETELRIEQLKVESAVSGRISVVSEGDLPLKPYKDRRKSMAALGGMMGLCFGVGIVLLIGSMDRRLRSLDDAQDTLGQLTMLGILPRLPDDLAEPEHAAVAAHCVHQVRMLLQIGSEAQGRRVFAVTSPGAQDGKTSLALALGVSFASSGSKTLLVDCDVIGGGLTLRVDTIIRRKIGQVLQREQLVTQQQVDEALQIAQESNRRLGETLIELGYLTQEDLDEALTLQEQTPVGLIDALDGEPLEECVAATGIRSMDILPVGGAEAYDVCRVSPTAVRRLLEEARGQYDVVVIDTGPVPGSLEASHICAEADGVIMVVARGEQRNQAEKSVNHLYSIGARVLGLVFNRAEGTDVQVLSASLSDALSEAQSFDDDGTPGRSPTRLGLKPDESEESSRFDPVARAVASSSQGSRHNGSRS